MVIDYWTLTCMWSAFWWEMQKAITLQVSYNAFICTALKQSGTFDLSFPFLQVERSASWFLETAMAGVKCPEMEAEGINTIWWDSYTWYPPLRFVRAALGNQFSWAGRTVNHGNKVQQHWTMHNAWPEATSLTVRSRHRRCSSVLHHFSLRITRNKMQFSALECIGCYFWKDEQQASEKP